MINNRHSKINTLVTWRLDEEIYKELITRIAHFNYLSCGPYNIYGLFRSYEALFNTSFYFLEETHQKHIMSKYEDLVKIIKTKENYDMMDVIHIIHDNFRELTGLLVENGLYGNRKEKSDLSKIASEGFKNS